MKHAALFLPLFFTLLVLAFGIFMPQITASVLDRDIAETTVEIDNAAVSLTLAQEMELIDLPEMDFFQTLALVSGQYSFVELSEGFRMTSGEAGLAAMFPANYMDADILDLDAAPDQVTPLLLTSITEENLSGVFWYCTWKEEPDNVVWIDDQTGAAVCFRFQIKNRPLSHADLTGAAAEYCVNISQQIPNIQVRDIILDPKIPVSFIVLEKDQELPIGTKNDLPEETFYLSIQRFEDEAAFNCSAWTIEEIFSNKSVAD